jgi:hypothetical protein
MFATSLLVGKLIVQPRFCNRQGTSNALTEQEYPATQDTQESETVYRPSGDILVVRV